MISHFWHLMHFLNMSDRIHEFFGLRSFFYANSHILNEDESLSLMKPCAVNLGLNGKPFLVYYEIMLLTWFYEMLNIWILQFGSWNFKNYTYSLLPCVLSYAFTKIHFYVSRGLVGYRSVFSSDTRGTGFMHRAFLSMLEHNFSAFQPWNFGLLWLITFSQFRS